MAWEPDNLHDAVHTALRAWLGDMPQTVLDEALLVRERRRELAQQNGPVVQGLAVKHVLLEALEALEQQDETAGHILRARFLNDNTLLMVANRLNRSEHTISRMQRAAIGQLAAILADREQALRNRRSEEIKAQLPPPTYQQLFGVEESRARLHEHVHEEGAPEVIAVVGIGGIGKTALVDRVVRDAIDHFCFDRVVWLRFDAGTMSGRALSAEHAVTQLMGDLATQLGGTEQVTSEQQGAYVRQRLKATPHLVIIDNLEDVAATVFLLNHLVELAEPSKFVLTTRTRPPGQSAVFHFSISELPFADAAALLRHHAAEIGVNAVAEASEADLRRIYDVTGGNPLALKLVASLLDLLPLTQVLVDLARSRTGPVEELYRHIYWQTWQTLSREARQLLQAMPLVAEAGGDPDYLQAISGLEASAFWPALQELRARSLLEVRGTLQEKRYGVHRLTETFVRTEIAQWEEE